MDHVAEHPFGLIYSLDDELGGFFGNIDADPLAVESVGCYTRCCASTERIEHDIVHVATCFYDALQQCDRLLCRISGTLL